MKITFIGMSGAGKTFWSKKLELKGFKRFCCDDLIEEKLNKELKLLGYCGIADVSKWMGQPYESRHNKNSERYLHFEKEVMEYILTYLEKSKVDENIVIDTTGSVIYTGNEIPRKLKALSHIVYLHTPSLIQKQMCKEYIINPKPVIWGNAFSKKRDENDLAALQRCYPNFLEFRVKKYKETAEIILDYYLLRHKIFTEEVMLKIIKQYDQIL